MSQGFDRATAAVVPRLAAPLAAVLAMAALAAFQADPVARAETGYLALAAGVGLLAAAGVAPRPSAETVGGALLVTATVWALPHGPARGAVALALAGAALAVAAVRWLPAAATRGMGGGPAAPGAPERAPGVPILPVLALALGLQAFLRGAELLGPGSALRGTALFVAFPVAGTAALLALARHHGLSRALLAGAAVVLAGPGFRPATVATLVALAAGSRLLARDGRPAVRSIAGAPEALRHAPRLAAAVLLAAPFAWDPRTAAACLAAGVAAGLAVDGGTGTSPRRWLAPAVAGALLATVLLVPGRPAAEIAPLASLVVLAVPGALLPGRARAPVALAALLLAVAAARGVTVDGALAPAAGLAALAVPHRGPVPALQGAWSGVLLAGGSLLAAYPWLRAAPLPDALDLLGLEPRLATALPVVAGAALIAGVAGLAAPGGWSSDSRRSERTAARAVGLVALALLLVHLPPTGAVPVAEPGLVLGAGRRTWSTLPDRSALPGGRVGSIVVDSSLANAAALPGGTPVATLRLREPGRPDRAWIVRVGDETGEWAAGRPDLRDAPPPAPRPWTGWVAEGGDFFGHRYRSVHRLASPAAPARVELALRPDLPPDVTLTVFHLELRP